MLVGHPVDDVTWGFLFFPFSLLKEVLLCHFYHLWEIKGSWGMECRAPNPKRTHTHARTHTTWKTSGREQVCSCPDRSGKEGENNLFPGLKKKSCLTPGGRSPWEGKDIRNSKSAGDKCLVQSWHHVPAVTVCHLRKWLCMGPRDPRIKSLGHGDSHSTEDSSEGSTSSLWDS